MTTFFFHFMVFRYNFINTHFTTISGRAGVPQRRHDVPDGSRSSQTTGQRPVPNLGDEKSRSKRLQLVDRRALG